MTSRTSSDDESIVAGKAPGMNPLAEHLFVWLNRGADSAARFFSLPYERVFEVGFARRDLKPRRLPQ